jgi:predicted lipoprotein with Yx(FWY)xxD motif
MVAVGVDGRPLDLDHRCEEAPANVIWTSEQSIATKGASMTRSRTITYLAGAGALLLMSLALAGCGGGGGASAQAAAPKTANGQPATVGVADSGLGKILVDSQGRTLYLFQKDSGTTSACTGACASAWPPLRASGQPTVGSGAKASLVGTTTRSDGNPQVTYNGHPLYLYVGDKAPGDTNGQGLTAFGGGWFVLSAVGNQVSGSPANSGGGGGGY